MKLDMKELNPAAKFTFSDDPDSGVVHIRVMTPGKLAEIRDQTILTKVEYKNHNRFEYTEIDYAKRDQIVWDYCIVSWEGLDDDDGKPIPCTTENKLRLMNEHPGFAGFVNNCLEKLQKDWEKRQDYLEKN